MNNNLVSSNNQKNLKSKGAIQVIILAVIIAFGLLLAAFAVIPQMISDRNALTALNNIYDAHKTASGNSRQVAYGCSSYSTTNMVSRLSDNLFYDESTDLVLIDVDDMTAASGCSTMPTSSDGSGASSASKPFITFSNVNNAVCSDVVSQLVTDARALKVTTDGTTLAIKHSDETTPGNFGEVGGAACNSTAAAETNTITIWEK